METRKKIIAEHVLVIHPVAFTLFQYFNLNDIHAFSLLNHSASDVTTFFFQNKSIKNNIKLKEKSFNQLQNDAKKLQTYLPGTKDPVERKAIQTLLQEVEEGKADAKTLATLMTKEWKCTSHTQEVIKDIADSSWAIGDDFKKTLENRDITENDLYFLLITYGFSGISYLTSFAFSAYHHYFGHSIQQQFKNRLAFFSENFNQDEKDKKDHEDDPNPGSHP